jgi:FlaA1/EpsC-like NDP-sugar epimerase
VKTLPSINEILGDEVKISDIKDLNIDELLNRDEIKPNAILLNQNIVGKTILVTGAGGSIGSELCRQIIKFEPKKLLLFEFNEFALYKIHEELMSFNYKSKIIPLLVDAKNQKKIETIFETFKVDTVYHAAAYKHVPLVEENICEALKNNVFSTLAIAKASVNKKISSMVLVSSDKAVRPTNIMGASKRLSELCVQAICNSKKNICTNFSIVRFGNVLESSGSVIPKFKEQIKTGGPITLTHKDVTRYFMTVTEASQLVIQAGAMGKKSEVYVLDMGKSVNIMNLIHRMVNLSGLSILDENNLNGDIEIKIIGLRPGEKLHEELMIGDNPQKTSHSKILKITENYIPIHQLELHLKELNKFIEKNNVNEIKNLLQNHLKIYNSNYKIIDHLYMQGLSGD